MIEAVTITSTAATDASPPLTVTCGSRGKTLGRSLVKLYEVRETHESGGMLPERHPAGEIVGQDGRAHAKCHSADHEERDDAAEEPVVVAHCGAVASGNHWMRRGLHRHTDPDAADVESASGSA